MGVLKLRDLSEIHDNSYSLGFAGLTILTYINHQPYEFEGLISLRNYREYSCCTNYSYKSNNQSKQYENSFIGLPIDKFPSSYKNMELVTQWINFINDLFPFFDIQMISDFNGKIINKEYWKTKNLRFTFHKDKIYFVIKKDTKINNFFALFQLSLLRYFVSSEYYFMIYDCLRLRDREDLSHLTNWQIMNIARFGVQINKQQFVNSQNSYYQYAFLRDYRSPICNSAIVKSLNNEKTVINNLENYDNQNISCHTKFLKLNILYLMKLFENEDYLKLYSIITNKKYQTNSDGVLEIIQKELNNFTQFKDINNLEFNLEKYEKTL